VPLAAAQESGNTAAKPERKPGRNGLRQRSWGRFFLPKGPGFVYASFHLTSLPPGWSGHPPSPRSMKPRLLGHLLTKAPAPSLFHIEVKMTLVGFIGARP
jgi:hypothetical protein